MHLSKNLVAVLFLSYTLFGQAVLANDLEGHHSPYLAMHGNDPIQWSSWGEEALEKARKENKLLYVSIGYGTYMPRDHFHGVLQTIGKRWKDDPDLIKGKAKDLSHQLKGMLGVLELTTKEHSIGSRRAEFLKKTMEQADDLQGGFGNKKFPNIPQLSALLTVNAIKPDPEIDEFLRLTLDAIISKGLHDAIGGGFFRYTIDPGWLTPHFEKMLYTNAQMPILLLKAADYFNEPHYRAIALETLDFLSRSMKGGKAFIASLSAVDEDGNEGAYYLWTTEELTKKLGKQDASLAFAAWDLDRENDFSFGNLPTSNESIESLAKAANLSVTETSSRLNSIRSKLLKHRSSSRQLPRDDKQLASWNGLALSAFAEALPYQSKYLELWDGKQLKRSAASNQAGTLLDYAAVANGLLAWSEASKQPRYAAIAGVSLYSDA